MSKRDFAVVVILSSGIYAVITIAIVVLVLHWDWTYIGLSLGILFASATLGILAGFVFGVPRTSATSDVDILATDRLVLNSNLVKVSDWLTTIIIGLGLVQFRELLDGLGWLGRQFEVIFGGHLQPTAAAAFGLSLTFTSLGLAFVAMYLWTSAMMMEVFADLLARRSGTAGKHGGSG